MQEKTSALKQRGDDTIVPVSYIISIISIAYDRCYWRGKAK